MPPQRRKIVPPTTTNKGRRKIAGVGASTGSEPDTIATQVDSSTPVDTASGSGTAATSDAAPVAAPETSEVSLAKPALPTTKPAATSATPSPDLRPRPEAGVGSASASESAEPFITSTPSRLGWRHVLIVGVIALVLGIFAAVAAFKPFATVDNAAWVDFAATQEVTAAATNAMQTLYTYKAGTIDADFDAARAVLGPSMLDQFNSTADTTKSAVVQTDTGTDANVTDVGVVRLEDDKAELLVNMNVSATEGGAAKGSAEGPLTINMEKIDGTWKLSAIDDQ